MNKKKSRESAAKVGKRQVLKEQRLKKQRQQRLIWISGISILALIVAGLLIIPSIQAARAPVGEIISITPNPRPQAQANEMGDPNAPVQIVEYSDFQCPFCKRFADETEQQIIDAYVKTGKVHFVFRTMGNFVSDNVGRGKTESRDAAEAAYCASEQNKFWEYKDMLFANWKGEDEGAFAEKRLMAFAEALGLDMNQFRSCYNSHQFRDQVQKDYQDGVRAGVDGTPSFVINGKLVKGALPFSDFQTEIEAALSASSS